MSQSAENRLPGDDGPPAGHAARPHAAPRRVRATPATRCAPGPRDGSVAPDEEHEAVIESLVRARLLSSDGDTVEIAHEALALAWPRLRSWLDDDVEGLRIMRHLAVAADSWEELGRPRERALPRAPPGQGGAVAHRKHPHPHPDRARLPRRVRGARRGRGASHRGAGPPRASLQPTPACRPGLGRRAPGGGDRRGSPGQDRRGPRRPAVGRGRRPPAGGRGAAHPRSRTSRCSSPWRGPARRLPRHAEQPQRRARPCARAHRHRQDHRPHDDVRATRRARRCHRRVGNRRDPLRHRDPEGGRPQLRHPPPRRPVQPQRHPARRRQ